ncbi:unnamed protein product, partial [Owenia fusiformis]
ISSTINDLSSAEARRMNNYFVMKVSIVFGILLVISISAEAKKTKRKGKKPSLPVCKKADIVQLENALKADITELGNTLKAGDSELKSLLESDIAELKNDNTEIKSALSDMETKLLAKLGERQDKLALTIDSHWRDITGACIESNNNRIIDSVGTMDDCKKLCENEEDFECRSIDYHACDRRCQLSVKYSGNNPIKDPCHAGPKWNYAELVKLQNQQCSYNLVNDSNWRDITGACIENNNNRIIDSVGTMDDCKKLCEIEDDFECRSIDYNACDRRCQLSVKYSGNNPINNPCHAGPLWSYAERQ